MWGIVELAHLRRARKMVLDVCLHPTGDEVIPDSPLLEHGAFVSLQALQQKEKEINGKFKALRSLRKGRAKPEEGNKESVRRQLVAGIAVHLNFHLNTTRLQLRDDHVKRDDFVILIQ